MRFIREHQRGEEIVASLCGRFGVSRKTGYGLRRAAPSARLVSGSG